MINDSKKLIEEPSPKVGFKLFTEVLGGLQIIASPLIPAAIVGFVIYISKPGPLRLGVAVGITLAGLLAGIICAIHISKKKGTINFISQNLSSPDLDK
jgi:hypothetical protein